VRSVILAVLAHLLLLAALTMGLQWKRESQDAAAEAELWSAVPQQAAPKEVEPPPKPVAKPQPKPEPKVEPKPEPQPDPHEAEIALEQQKKKKKEAEARRREEEAERERQKKLQAQREEEERKEERRKEQEHKLAAEKKQRLEEEKKRKQREEQEKKLAKLREENLKHMQALAGGTGAPSATGNAQRSSGPSDSWGDRIRARVKPNIVFTDDIAGNPSAEVEVRLAPDGTITGKRLMKSSGNKAWDEAVLRALDKTETLPRDTDGRVHSPVVIDFKPRG
jgi:colicin import membrane protein